jgi:hypothetical protein
MATNYSGALSGGLGGAASGATIGTAIAPGVGTAVGAGVGGIAGLLAGLFGGGNEGGIEQGGTPEQQNLLAMLLQLGQQNLQNPYQGFDPIQQQAEQQFATKTIPGLAERFTSLGNGAQNSSAFQGALGSAASGLHTQLGALRAQYGMQNQQNALQQLQLGLGQNVYRQSQPGIGGQLLQGAIQAAPSAIGAYSQNQMLEKLLAAAK